jgi:hypothetical protein
MPSTQNTSSYDPSEKRLSFVYNSDISGFQPLDFGKLNNVEDILITFSGDGINVHQDDLNPIVDAVSVSGHLYSIISGFDAFGINVHQDDLNPVTDAVTAVPEKGHVISNYTSSNSNGTAVNANSLRKELFVQNLATGALYVKYGPSASNTSFNFILAGCTFANAGDGGSISDQRYTGIVSVSGANNLTSNYISWEMT